MTRRGGALLAFALLALAPAASAGPVKDGVYGSAYGGKVSLNLMMAASGKKIDTFYLELPTSCRVGNVRPHYPTTFSPTPDMVVKRGGNFGYTKMLRGPRPGAVQKWKLAGRFSADGRKVTVTARYTLRRPDGWCDTKTRTAVASLKSLRTPGPFTGPYAGRTAAGEPITFTVQHGSVTDVRTHVTLKCDDGSTVARDIHIDQIKADESGFDDDSITGNFDDPFKVVGTLTPREPLPPTADDPNPGFCSATDAFTATPGRELDS